MNSTLHITKPHNCILAITLPLTKADFFDDLKSDSKKDYAKCRLRKFKLRHEALWELDHAPLTAFINELCGKLQAMGVKVIYNFSRASFAAIDSGDVFTIFAHWVENEGMIELYDGLVTVENFEEKVPPSFNGIFDLTICHSIHLQTYLKKKRNNLVIANVRTTSVKFKLIKYYYTMKYLERNNVNYIDALAEINKNII